MSPPRARRKEIAEDTLARTPDIVASTPGASLDSTFIASQLPPLDRSKSPDFPSSKVSVINSDSFRAARGIIREHPEEANGKVAVLNLASDEVRAGGWLYSLTSTQEEALCYSSTLYATLKEEYYPWPNLGPGSVAGVFSPAVVVFKDDLDHDCVDLPEDERILVSVITVAAPRGPKLTPDGESLAREEDKRDFEGKIRLVYRMAASNGQHYMVLAAMGCGAYACPPRQVANMMKSILLEPEFKGWFRRVVFAVYSSTRNGPGNYGIFKEILDGVEL
ncbi:hypothetical protein GLOTRDRAFT_75286 [Gloeophyllum trabeum ATCC 11539]|uniref:Microbial-type PARG catalytic domain-containing protein n=1 Tax=Gloeophyllum trabeum (strain ATCC 11539 / FP-39264 / Madison 617) TaxID=670483 RepID=S7RTS5_GLOTA|nr:uncharacterized protein GLOTRDRAFT_75286 [Gloeophyllum trabeum ATCC 11539]EPQ56549.1 hypothetical protein GLOTRDRAFT_75286 [Gloeophyllum trabeum ATCC 11539]